MARRPDSEAIARGPCITKGCDQTILVFRTKRRGNYLMGRCPDCKAIDGTGKAVQNGLQAIVDGTATEQAPEPAKAPQKPPEAALAGEDFDPGEITNDTTTEPTPKKGGAAGLALLALAVVGGIFFYS